MFIFLQCDRIEVFASLTCAIVGLADQFDRFFKDVFINRIRNNSNQPEISSLIFYRINGENLISQNLQRCSCSILVFYILRISCILLDNEFNS